MAGRNKLKRQCPPNDPSCTSSTSASSTSSTVVIITTTLSSTHLSSSSTAATASTSASTSASASPTSSSSSSSDAGTIAGSVVGGVVFLLSLLLAILLYLRRRKRRRTAPSSEFMNSIKEGAAPVLRLDSGAEYIPAIPEKGGTIPLSFAQNSYYPSPPMQNMRFPDDMLMKDIPSQRPSMDQPLHPQRFSSQHGHDLSTSAGSRRELWGSETEIDAVELPPVRQSSLCADSVLQFAPRFSLQEPPSQTIRLSHSPTSLQPLRRQPD